MAPPKFITTTEAGIRLGITRKGVRWLILNNRIPAIRVGHAYIIKAETFEKYLAKRKKAATEGA